MRTVEQFATAQTAKTTDTIDLAVAQMLALAERANVSFHVVDDRLIMRAARMDPKLWPPVRWYLDEIGVEAIKTYFQRTTSEDRATLSAAA